MERLMDANKRPCFEQLCNELNSCSRSHYTLLYEKHENCIDFLSSGELKRVVGIQREVSDRITYTIRDATGSLADKNYYDVSIIIKMKDFTSGKSDTIQAFSIFTTPGPKEGENYAKRIHKFIQQDIAKVERLYTPSKALSHIVGEDAQPRYSILVRVSDYILTKQLLCSNGDVECKELLKGLCEKDRVDEDNFFHILRKNTKQFKSNALERLDDNCLK
jgi:hypothetical protein